MRKVSAYVLCCMLYVLLGYFVIRALDLPEKKEKQRDDWRKSQAAALADILKKAKFSGDFSEVDQKFYPEDFVPLSTYYFSREAGNTENIFVCFYPLSKYHRAGTEMDKTLNGLMIEYRGVLSCRGTCLECVKR